MEAHHFSSQAHDLESCRLQEENRQLKLELKAIKDLAQKTEGERQFYCQKLMEADERIKELEETKSKMYDANQLMNANIKELEATISIMETTAPKWISVEDGMPDNDTWVLVYHEGEMDVDHYLPGVYTQCFMIYEKVTHWMPLPSAPTTEESTAVEKKK